MKNDFEDDWPKIKAIDGWLSKSEANALYDLAGKCKTYIVEIGAYKGRSTTCLGLGSRNSPYAPKIISIDPFTGSKEHRVDGVPIDTWNEYRDNVEANGLFDVVNPMQMTSKEARDKFHSKIDLLFIDGSHEYEDVKYDFLAWRKLVHRGGHIAIHDYNWSGPNRVVREFVSPREYIIPKKVINSLLILKVR